MGVVLTLFSVVPAITNHTIPRWVYWLAAFACFVITAYKMWSEQYDRAEAYKREVDEVYADVVLDYLKQHHPARFPATTLADLMKYDVEKVVRGLKVLEMEFKVVGDEGAAGWFFDYQRMLSLGLYSNLRRLL